MKLFSKIFLSAMAAVIVAVSVTEYFVVSASFRNSLDREIESELDTYSMMEYSLKSGLLSAQQDSYLNDRTLAGIADGVSRLNSGESFVALVCNREMIYSKLPEGYVLSFPENSVSDSKLTYRISQESSGRLLAVFGSFEFNEQTYLFMTGKNIDSVFQEKEELEKQYNVLFFIILTVSIPLLYLLSWFLTNPIRKLSSAAMKLSEGNYNERVNISSHDEIGELGGHFNWMAEAVEKNVLELKDQARQKEDFVNGFAHELKTPLTSIIGYADLLQQKKLDEADQEKAHNYIFNEGLRLEALSHKMMDLSILNRQIFLLEETEISGFFGEMDENVRMWLNGKGIRYHSDLEPAWLNIEPDLFQSLMMNLLDNAVKSGTHEIQVYGESVENAYSISVTDKGCGMPEEELSRITEAFYMVDKSRSRKLHGAGLGLAIAKRIIEIHNGSLIYRSKVGVGTTAILTLPMAKGGAGEDE